MKLTQEVRDLAAAGTFEKSAEFRKAGSDLYLPVGAKS